VDIPGEGIVLEYSTNNGASWTLMGTYDTSTFYSWTQVTTNIPSGALSAATQFRWRQLSHSGTCCDHWALDDINIDAGPTPPSILTQPSNQYGKGRYSIDAESDNCRNSTEACGANGTTVDLDDRP